MGAGYHGNFGNTEGSREGKSPIKISLGNIGHLKDDKTYYFGHKGEPGIRMTLINHSEFSLYIWEGYFSDIFSDPPMFIKPWKGFTKEYQGLTGLFAGVDSEIILDPSDYITDLELYKDRTFHYEETMKVYQLLVEFLELARKWRSPILVQWN